MIEFFSDLFDALEYKSSGIRQSLGLGGFLVSNTTLEEVFLQLAEEKDEEEVKEEGDKSKEDK